MRRFGDCPHVEAGRNPKSLPSVLPPSPPPGKPSFSHFSASVHSQPSTGWERFPGRGGFPLEKVLLGQGLSHWPIMQAILQATAEMRAAPRPLPSSDCKKVMSQPGVSCVTVAWNRSLKLGKNKEREKRKVCASALQSLRCEAKAWKWRQSCSFDTGSSGASRS